ncbi:DUF2510 domain-containing protein [Microbacterium sp. NPDC058345]|uniref:DUF2510 domain-containing protein n=1 Tax=Microbacterium sp. NPDC058345 TaxID=3346455 RepID=UPI0036661262
MSTPAGWYDDGSGRQRWWDGTRWTDDFAPAGAAGGASAPEAPQSPAASGDTAPYGSEATGALVAGDAPYATPGSAPEARKPAPTLGFVGLGLAVLGTILACIPTMATFVIGIVVLLAAFVVSLIAVFKKNTKKWPSIVGIVLSIVGGVIGAIVFSVVLLVNLAGAVGENLPTGLPTPPASEQPSDQPADGTDERPTPQALAEGYLVIMDEPGLEEYRTPDVAECMGQFYYDSELPIDLLQRIAAGEIITYEGVGQELGEQFESVTSEGFDVCAPL